VNQSPWNAILLGAFRWKNIDTFFSIFQWLCCRLRHKNWMPIKFRIGNELLKYENVVDSYKLPIIRAKNRRHFLSKVNFSQTEAKTPRTSVFLNSICQLSSTAALRNKGTRIKIAQRNCKNVGWTKARTTSALLQTELR